MPWCPICKNEYVKGYTRCSDCDAELVESLDDGPKALIFGEEGPVTGMKEFLDKNGVEGAFVRFDEKDKAYELYVPADQVEESKKLLTFLLQTQAQEAAERQAMEAQLLGEEENEDYESDAAPDTPKAPVQHKAGSYVDKNLKAQEYRSSAYALIGVGAVGLVALVLLWMGVLPFNMYGMGKIMFTGVMGFLFLVFLIMGFNSIKIHKNYMEVASKENSLIDDVNAYMESNLKAEQVDKALYIDATNAEGDEVQAQLYFARMSYIKKVILEQFPSLELPLAEKLSDDWYSKQFD